MLNIKSIQTFSILIPPIHFSVKLMRRIVRKVFSLTYKEKVFTYLADDEEGEVVGDPCGQLPLHHLLQPAVPGQHYEALNEITFSKWKENHAT